MSEKRVLLLYISKHSGHHCASLAVEHGIREVDPQAKTLNMDSFNYTNPILEKIVSSAYLNVIKRTPEIWDYLYDNPKVVKSTQKFREMIHRFNTGKVKTLIHEFRPHAIVCTQAFPCGLIADYKKTSSSNIPLIGVLTDYAPHSYWIYDNVDNYIVPSENISEKLVNNGIDPARIKPFGIPIDPKFQSPADRNAIFIKLGIDRKIPVVLIMGGTQGLGPIKELMALLDKSPIKVRPIVVCGTNKKLYSWLLSRNFSKKVTILPYASNIDELMEISELIITKPGGITTAEALAKGVPMLIINPLPGQEAMNTRFLLDEGVAVKAESPQDVLVLLGELLYNRSKLKSMGSKARSLSKPDSSIKIAKLALELAEG